VLDDGTVLLRTERCVGCRYCEMACPFGAPAFDRRSGVMTKCHYCLPRREAGGSPACIEACPTGALQPLGEGASDLDCPGVADPVGCAPMLRLDGPTGAIRIDRLESLRASTSATPRTGGREERS
jgi:NAD-dependent dihydropyrimidine dehydrogenase PreA subunit